MVYLCYIYIAQEGSSSLNKKTNLFGVVKFLNIDHLTIRVLHVALNNEVGKTEQKQPQK